MYSKVFAWQGEIMRALANPRRLEIIQLLQDQEMCVSDIYSMLDLPQANVSQHLMVLRDTGLVEARREGKQMYYRVSHPAILKANDLLREVVLINHKDQGVTTEMRLSMQELVPIVHDPVCQMRLSPKTAGFKLNRKGKVYYFCASGCLAKFKAEPEVYGG